MYITIIVPDGDKCNGCDFLRANYVETSYGHGHIERFCGIFENKIKNGDKCNGCKICGKNKLNEGEMN